MAKFRGGGGGIPQGMNMNNLMKQAQKMQAQVQQVQEEVENKTIEVTTGGGAVKIEVTGKNLFSSIKINPDVVDPDDVEMLEDLILSAANEAIRQIEEYRNNEMSKVTGGMNLPGGLF